MCVIAAKPQNVPMPTEDTLETMWYNNPDGAGFMYPKDGKVQIRKGYMTWDSFKKALDDTRKIVDLDKVPVVLHFRITTHGGTKPENCHPFPVTDSIGLLKKKKLSAKLGVAHNGIIDITPRKGISDTMEYIISQLGPLQKAVPRFYKNEHLMEMISNAIDSKMVFMNGEGKIYTIGNFIEDGGIKYSNSTYKTWRYSKSLYYGCMDDDEDPYSYTRYKDYSKNTASYWSDSIMTYTGRALMWLDESKGDYIKDGTVMKSGDYAIDNRERVYEYSDKYSAMIHVPGAIAYTAEGALMKYGFNNDSVYWETIYEPKSKETGGSKWTK